MAGRYVDAEAPRVGGRRGEVLALLRAAGRPLGVQEVAERAGLHPNTARFHLDRLAAADLVDRTPEARATPGRRRFLYAARPEADEPGGGSRSYALLAEMLTGLVSSLGGADEPATAAGRAWGRHLVERDVPSRPASADESLHRLTRLLDDVGFRPQVVPADDGVAVHLHHCPFREVATAHTDVVCAIHLGLMQGALDELGAPWTARSLEPFVAPSLCVARIAAAG
jgi:predicted ArsR family transcriptional regulator